MISFLLKLWHGDQQAHQQFDMWMNGLGSLRKTPTRRILALNKNGDWRQMSSQEIENEVEARLQKCREWREGKEETPTVRIDGFGDPPAYPGQ